MSSLTTAPQKQGKMEFGAEGRKFFSFKDDGRRKGNKQAYPIPQCAFFPFGGTMRVIPTNEAISKEICHQIRQVDRREARKRKALRRKV